MFRFIVIKKKFSIFLIISYGVQSYGLQVMGTSYGYKIWVQVIGTRLQGYMFILLLRHYCMYDSSLGYALCI